MDIKVKSLYLKSSPRKIRPLLFGLRGQNADQTMTSLGFINRKGSGMLIDLLKSALAIAKENDLDSDKIFIKSIYCNEGPRLKRRLIGSRGRSNPILKRMSHINLVLSDQAEKEETKKPENKSSKEST